MDMKKEDPQMPKESKFPSRNVCLAVFLAFALGAYVKGEVSKKETEADAGSCEIVIKSNVNDDGKMATDMHAYGASDACASMMNALQAQSDAQDQDEAQSDDQADAPCDSASDAAANAPQGASQ